MSDPPPPPPPLPVPRYARHFTLAEDRSLQRDLLGGLADEILLLRSQMDGLLQYARRSLTRPDLARIVHLFSRAASRLGRLILHRQYLFENRPEPNFLDVINQRRNRPPKPVRVRSSKNINKSHFIDTPLRLTDYQWRALEPHLPPPPRPVSAGHPAEDYRDLFEAILWKLLVDLPWADLPDKYPFYTTCRRYYAKWRSDGTLDRLLAAFAAYQRTVPPPPLPPPPEPWPPSNINSPSPSMPPSLGKIPPIHDLEDNSS